jgi:hypothetical protein
MLLLSPSGEALDKVNHQAVTAALVGVRGLQTDRADCT